MPLIVCSNSTLEYAKSLDGDILKIEGTPTKEILAFRAKDKIIAVGGGGVIDAAKIIAANSGIEKIMAIPTTASGAVETSHAVYWNGHKKYSIMTPKPTVKTVPDLLKTLPRWIIRATSYDALSHAVESYWSKYATDISKALALEAYKIIVGQIRWGYPDLERLIRGGNLAGKAIEITGTNIVHAISYPLTGYYDIPHGLAVGLILPIVAKCVNCKLYIPNYDISIKKNYDIGLIAKEAMKYDRIHNAVKDVTKEQVICILEELF